jgi:DNA polymerase III gamma/tau subunit
MHHERNAKIFLELPWVEKYRPQALGDVVAQKDITQTLQIFIDKVW